MTKLGGWVRWVTRTSWFDFGSSPHPDPTLDNHWKKCNPWNTLASICAISFHRRITSPSQHQRAVVIWVFNPMRYWTKVFKRASHALIPYWTKVFLRAIGSSQFTRLLYGGPWSISVHSGPSQGASGSHLASLAWLKARPSQGRRLSFPRTIILPLVASWWAIFYRSLYIWPFFEKP